MRGAPAGWKIALASFAVLSTNPSTAAPAPAEPWSVKADELDCELATDLVDADGKLGARVQFHSRRGAHYTMMVLFSTNAPQAPWSLQTTGAGARTFAMGRAKDRIFGTALSFGEKLIGELGAGRGLLLIVRSGGDGHRYSSNDEGAAESLRAYERCVVAAKAAPPPPGPPPSWKVDSQGGRDCSLSTSLPGFTDVRIAFGIRQKTSLVFMLDVSSFERPDGGVLRIDLPGAAPWILDSKQMKSMPGARDSQLLAALMTLKPVPMTFTPHGARAASFSSPTENLAVAGAMFQACAAAVKAPDLPPQLQFTELRYVASEQEDECELTGTYQLQGNGLWLTLTREARKITFKVTRRTIKSGFRIASLDVSGFGGPKKLAAEDGSYELDAREFAVLRAALVGAGRDFGIRMSASESYTAQFGGKLAVVEAPMFEACVKTKFDQQE